MRNGSLLESPNIAVSTPLLPRAPLLPRPAPLGLLCTSAGSSATGTGCPTAVSTSDSLSICKQAVSDQRSRLRPRQRLGSDRYEAIAGLVIAIENEFRLLPRRLSLNQPVVKAEKHMVASRRGAMLASQ